MAERHREITLTIHYAVYGNEEQAIETSSRLLRILEVKGVEVIAATHNNIYIQAARP